jgi:N-acetylneuraminic acid mutarotase
MSIWGGTLGFGTYLRTGATYDPATDTWASITPLDAPDARSDHSTVWSGTELIVWGGYGSSGPIADGGRYQASNQSWLPLNSTGAPSERYNNAAVWTGTRMLIWGGLNNTGILNDGAVYDPGTDTWTAVAPSGGPAARHSGSAVLAGDSVIIWGGEGATGAMNDGAILNLSNGEPTAWSSIADSGAPSARSGHAAVWTGSKLIVWGGLQGGTHLSDGAIYDPAVGQDGTWAAMSATGAPAARANHAAGWTGSELVVIGGDGASGELSDSHAYNPATDTWRSLSGSTGARSGSSSEWTGSQVLIFGGDADGQALGQPMEIDPTPPVHLYRKQ